MKKSFWIPAIVLYVVNVIFCDSVQVGTVLFTTRDLVRKCWTECDKSLLKARLIMQDVLPDPDCIDFSNPEAVVILLDYFHACFQIISTSTYGKLQNLMYIALSDALGGYLRAYVLPFTRRAYYAGQVKYSEAKKLFQLYDEIKMFLKTNGGGWAEPQKPNYKNIQVTPLTITGGALEACKRLFTIEKRGKSRCVKANHYVQKADSYNIERAKKSKESSEEVLYENTKHFDSTFVPKFSWNSTKVNGTEDENKKLYSFKDKNSPNGQKFLKNFFDVLSMNTSEENKDEEKTPETRKSRCYCGCPKCSKPSYSNKRVVVPLPILDDCLSPHSIAVPFKKQPFRSLRSRSSAFVLEYYYTSVIKCLIAKGNSKANIRNFNSKFYSWLFSQVYPHLSEEQWYPAFGGVLRIMETIKRFGADNSVGDLASRDIGYLFDSGVEFEVEGNKRREKTRNVDVFEEECAYSKRHVLIAIILVSVIWIFVFCACVFYFQAGRGHSIFYEGYSDASSRSRNRDHRKKEKFINFQFLIKFFKNRKASDSIMGTQQVFWNVTKQKTKVPKEKKLDLKRRANEHLGSQPENERLISYGHGDFPALNIPALEKHLKSEISSWPCHPCLVPAEKLRLLKTEKMPEELNVPKDKRHRIEMLWKKPSIKFKRNVVKEGRERNSPKKKCDFIVSQTTTTTTTTEKTFGKLSSDTYSASIEDETKSTGKVSSTCCCSSETCQHSHSTTSDTSSLFQEQPSLPKQRPLPPPPLRMLRLKRN